MGYFNNYHEAAIQPGYVDHDGDYEVMILGTEDGTTPAPDNAAFKRVICKINYKGEPRISIFLTDGKNFDGNFTAFCDTFGIPRGNTDFKSWVGKRGTIHIVLTKKGEFVNMVPRYILDENGYVKKSNAPKMANNQNYGATTQNQEEDWGNDIPF